MLNTKIISRYICVFLATILIFLKTETTFSCRSIAYGRENSSTAGQCLLSSQSHWSAPELYTDDEEFDYCIVDIDECELNPCLNQGTCTDGFQTYTCTCKTGFSGKNCEIGK